MDLLTDAHRSLITPGLRRYSVISVQTAPNDVLAERRSTWCRQRTRMMERRRSLVRIRRSSNLRAGQHRRPPSIDQSRRCGPCCSPRAVRHSLGCAYTLRLVQDLTHTHDVHIDRAMECSMRQKRLLVGSRFVPPDACAKCECHASAEDPWDDSQAPGHIPWILLLS